MVNIVKEGLKNINKWLILLMNVKEWLHNIRLKEMAKMVKEC